MQVGVLIGHSKIMIQMRYINIQSNAIIYNLNQNTSQDMSLLPQRITIPPVKVEQATLLDEYLSPMSLTEVNRSRTWSRDELYRMAAFLHHNRAKFASESSKKHFKVFKLMSHYVRTRNINQCRSYTNKLLKSFGNLESVNAYFRESLPDYSRLVEQLQEKYEDTLHHDLLADSENSIIRTQHSIEKSNTETLWRLKPDQSCPKEQQSSGVIIPHPQWNPPYLTSPQQYPHNQEIGQLFRRQCLQWTLTINLLALFTPF